MTMTNEEIVRDYRQAMNKSKQIKILADRNEVTPDTIRSILAAAGVEGVKAPARKKEAKKKAAWDQDRARELLAEGKSIREIAEEVGTSYSAVWDWRKRAGL